MVWKITRKFERIYRKSMKEKSTIKQNLEEDKRETTKLNPPMVNPPPR